MSWYILVYYSEWEARERHDIGLHTAFQHLPKELCCQLHLPKLRRRSDHPIEGPFHYDRCCPVTPWRLWSLAWPAVGLQLRFMHAPEPSLQNMHASTFVGSFCGRPASASLGRRAFAQQKILGI